MTLERMSSHSASRRVAILVPCYNEAGTIGKVVRDLRMALPESIIFVYDNVSQDETARQAIDAGATVRVEKNRGKGSVVRRMFADIEADAYVLIDGDDTYDSQAAASAVDKLFAEGLDFINVARKAADPKAFRYGHAAGNQILSGIIRMVFGRQLHDIFSGLKIFSRRFVKSFPALSQGFEIEVELTIHALELRMPMLEIVALYRARPPGSVSKLSTLGDGWRVLKAILRLIKNERPMAFFGTIGLVSVVIGFLVSIPIFTTYFETGLVPRLPTAVLAIGFVLAGLQSITVAFVLDTVTTSRREMKRLAYLQIEHF